MRQNSFFLLIKMNDTARMDPIVRDVFTPHLFIKNFGKIEIYFVTFIII